MAAIPFQQVVALAAADEVVALVAVDHVVAAVAVDHVIAPEAAHRIVEFGKLENVVAIQDGLDELEVVPRACRVAGLPEIVHRDVVPVRPMPPFFPVAAIDEAVVRNPGPLAQGFDRADGEVAAQIFGKAEAVQAERVVCGGVDEIVVFPPVFIGVVVEFFEIQVGVPEVQIIGVEIRLVLSEKLGHG